MPRTSRIVISGVPHHVTQRGNNRQDVFFVDDDRRVYLSLLGRAAQKEGLSLMGYCLMTNHVHLIAIPSGADSLARALGRTHFHYSQYINQLHKRSGHLWQARFYSCALDERHAWAALRYVEQNPVRARLAREPWDWAWSSAAAHVGDPDGSGMLDLAQWRQMMAAADWRAELSRRLPEEDSKPLRANTLTGRPLGSDGFISKLETKLGRRLRPLPGGRPKKEARGKE
jgi:putative transposase